MCLRNFVFILISDDKNIFVSNSTIDVGRRVVLPVQHLLRTNSTNAAKAGKAGIVPHQPRI